MHESGHPKPGHWDNAEGWEGREAGGGSGWDTCSLMADSRQRMAETATTV